MAVEVSQKDEFNAPKIVNIFRGRRISNPDRPSTYPPSPVSAIFAPGIPQGERIILAEAEIRADIRGGDQSLSALKKCRFVLENSHDTFSEKRVLEKAVTRTIKIISDYGEPEGTELLADALERFGDNARIRAAVSEAVSRIGCESDFDLILISLREGRGSKSRHFAALLEFAERYPTSVQRIIDSLRAVKGVDSEEAIRKLETISKEA